MSLTRPHFGIEGFNPITDTEFKPDYAKSRCPECHKLKDLRHFYCFNEVLQDSCNKCREKDD